YYVDLRLSLQIYDDGAYVLSATPGSRGNNVGKPFIEVGQAYERGRDLVLRTEDGSTRVLRKSGDTLYGMAEDPLSGRSVIDRLGRIRSRSGQTAGGRTRRFSCSCCRPLAARAGSPPAPSSACSSRSRRWGAEAAPGPPRRRILARAAARALAWCGSWPLPDRNRCGSRGSPRRSWTGRGSSPAGGGHTSREPRSPPASPP